MKINYVHFMNSNFLFKQNKKPYIVSSEPVKFQFRRDIAVFYCKIQNSINPRYNPLPSKSNQTVNKFTKISYLSLLHITKYNRKVEYRFLRDFMRTPGRQVILVRIFALQSLQQYTYFFLTALPRYNSFTGYL